MATPQAPQKTPVASAVQAALPLPAAAAPAAPEEKNDLVLLAPTPELNPRNRIMKEIAARSNADADANAAETVPVLDDDGNPIAPAAPAPAAPEDGSPDEPAPAPVEAPAPAATPAPAPVEAAPPFDPNAEIEVIVDGKPLKVKGSQIIERGRMAIQKEIAADHRLELASRLLAEAQERSKAAPATPQPAAAPDAPTDAQLAQAIQFGTQEQAAAAIAEVQRRSGPGITPDQIKEMMAKTMPAVVQDQLAFHEGVNFVKTEYGDLLADPYLQPLFVLKEQQMRQAGDKRPYKEVYRAIGEDMRTHFNRPKTTPAATAATPATREQKVAAKAAAPAAPKLASARMEAAAEQRPATREEIFEKMRRARGQGLPQRLSQQ